VSWETIYRRVATAERRLPRPPVVDDDVDLEALFTPAERERFGDVRDRYPDCPFGPDDLWMVADADLAFLAQMAERAKSWRAAPETERAPRVRADGSGHVEAVAAIAADTGLTLSEVQAEWDYIADQTRRYGPRTAGEAIASLAAEFGLPEATLWADLARADPSTGAGLARWLKTGRRDDPNARDREDGVST